MIEKLQIKEIDIPIGRKISLKKISQREKSCIPIGNKRILLISNPIKIGSEISVYYKNAKPHPSGDKRYCTYNATSIVCTIEKISKTFFFLNTKTSLYSLSII